MRPIGLFRAKPRWRRTRRHRRHRRGARRRWLLDPEPDAGRNDPARRGPVRRRLRRGRGRWRRGRGPRGRLHVRRRGRRRSRRLDGLRRLRCGLREGRRGGRLFLRRRRRRKRFGRFFEHRRRSRRLGGLHQPGRCQRGRGRLRGLGLARAGGRLAGFRGGALGEHVAARQRDAAFAGQALHELPRDHFLERTRRALQLDPVRALQQREHFLAARVEEFRDFIDTNSCQTLLLD